MKSLVLVSLLGLASCGGDWRTNAINDAERLVRQQFDGAPVTFEHVRVTGDSRSGQTCGYVERPVLGGGVASIRFIYFVDGGGGQNPYLDVPSAPYPTNKSDFDLNWRTQCLDLGYRT